jgi:hypothetical protein
MDLSTDDIRAAGRSYLTDRYPPDRIARAADETGHDLAAWTELVRQGWFDGTLPPDGLAILAEESGRALHPVPWWTTMAAAPAWRDVPDPPTGPSTAADADCAARLADGAWRLTGDCGLVTDGSPAAAVVVAGRTDEGLALFSVPADGPGVTWQAVDGIDPLRTEARLRLANAPARLLVDAGRAAAVRTEMRRQADVLLACEAVGVAERALQVAIGHAGVRRQFGRPIGSFQAVAHRLADCYAETELARSLAHRAATLLGTAADAAQDEAIACARHAAGTAAVRVCEAAVQVHGAMGLTWDFPLHRWYRRALWIEGWWLRRGDPLDEVAAALLGPVAA